MSTMFSKEKEILERFPDTEIKNGMVRYIDINVIGHFGNVITIDMPIESCGVISNPIHGYGATLACGVYIRLLFELFDISEEDGKRISSVKNIPCRVVRHGMRIVGIGNFLTDRFIVFDDLSVMYDEFVDNVKK